MDLHKWKTRQNTALILTTACVACLLLPFKRHSRNAFGVHEGFIVYTCNQIATFCSEPAKGGKDAYVLEEKYIGP